MTKPVRYALGWEVQWGTYSSVTPAGYRAMRQQEKILPKMCGHAVFFRVRRHVHYPVLDRVLYSPYWIVSREVRGQLA